MGKTRDTYWDSLKFVLVFLVVLGHNGYNTAVRKAADIHKST